MITGLDTQRAETAQLDPAPAGTAWQHIVMGAAVMPYTYRGRPSTWPVYREMPTAGPRSGRCGRVDGELWRMRQGTGAWWARRHGYGVRLQGQQDGIAKACGQVGWLLVTDAGRLLDRKANGEWAIDDADKRTVRLLGTDGSILEFTAATRTGDLVSLFGSVVGRSTEARSEADRVANVQATFGALVVNNLAADLYGLILRAGQRVVCHPESD